jgi:hypothetical protein
MDNNVNLEYTGNNYIPYLSPLRITSAHTQLVQ